MNNDQLPRINGIEELPDPQIKSSMDSLWESIKLLVESLKKEKDDKLSFSDKLGILETVHAESQKKYDDLNFKMSAVEKQLEEFTAANKKLTDNNSSLMEKLDKSRAVAIDLEETRSAYEKLKANLEGMEAKVRSIPELNEKLHDSLSKLESMETEKATLVESIEELKKVQANFELAQEGIAKKNHELHKRSEEIDDLKNTLAIAQSKAFEFQKKYEEMADGEEFGKKLEELNMQVQLQKSVNREQEDRFNEELAKYKQIWESQEATLEDKTKYSIELQNEINELQNKINNIESEKISGLETALAKKNEELKNSAAKYELLEKEKSQATEKICDLEEKIESEKKESLDRENRNNTKAFEAVNKLRDDLDSKELIISNLNDQNSRLQELNANSENTINEFLEKESELEDRISAAEEKYEDSKKEIASLNEKVSSKDKIIDEYSTQIMNMEILEEEKNDEVNKLKEDISSLEDRLKLESMNVEDLKKKFDDSLNEKDEIIQKLNDSMSNAMDNYDELKKSVKEIEADNENLQKKINDKDLHINQQQSEIAELNRVKLHTYSTMQDLQEELNVAKKKLADSEKQMNAYLSQHEDISEELEEIASKNLEYEEKILELENDLEKERAENSKRLEDIHELKNLKVKVDEKDKLVKDFSQHIKNLNDTNLKSYNEIKKYKEDIETLETERAKESAELKRLNYELEKLQNEIEIKQDKSVEVSKQNLLQYEKIKQLESSASDLQNEMKTLEEELDSLRINNVEKERQIEEKSNALSLKDEELAQVKELENKYSASKISLMALETKYKELGEQLRLEKEKSLKADSDALKTKSEMDDLKDRVHEDNEIMLKLQTNLQSKDELLHTLGEKIKKYEDNKAKDNLNKLILIDKIEKYMSRLEKSIPDM